MPTSCGSTFAFSTLPMFFRFRLSSSSSSLLALFPLLFLLHPFPMLHCLQCFECFDSSQPCSRASNCSGPACILCQFGKLNQFSAFFDAILLSTPIHQSIPFSFQTRTCPTAVSLHFACLPRRLPNVRMPSPFRVVGATRSRVAWNVCALRNGAISPGICGARIRTACQSRS